MATVPEQDKQATPKRIVIRHLSGSKANQVEEFPLDHFSEVTIGRTASSSIKYDPDKDDLVSREHATISADPLDPHQFTIRDLDSRNGVYVNKQKITGTAAIAPSDVIQLGPGGPEFEFDLEPRPAAIRQTRIAPGATERPTRAVGAAVPTPAAAATPAEAHQPVGKATVERMVAQAEQKSQKTMIYGIGAVVVVVLALVAFFMMQDTPPQPSTSEGGAVTPQEIGATYGDATVYIEVGWKLIHTQSGGQVYHQFTQLLDQSGQPAFDPTGQPIIGMAFVQLQGGVIEPVLTLDADQGQPIGGQSTGSGFVVSNDGFILTNRHVAASWFTSYTFPQGTFPGILYVQSNDGSYVQAGTLEQHQMPRWVPAESKFFGFKPASGKILEGRNDYLDVTFAKNELRIPAQLVRTSNRHDVAMMKIDMPQSLNAVTLHDNYDTIEQGNEVTVLGYPSISPDVVVQTQSQDVFNRQTQWVKVPDPTLTTGRISRIIRGAQTPADRTTGEYYSTMGDTYQLDVVATGGGNSGGPVFDDEGRVVGIFTAASTYQGTRISFATPIRYGIELMGTTPVVQ